MSPMAKMLEKLVSESTNGALEAQIRFKDGFGVAGALKKSSIEGVYECLAIGETNKTRVPVLIYFDPEDVQTIGRAYETVLPSQGIIRP